MEGEMASSRVTPPEPSDFSTPEEWPQWMRRFGSRPHQLAVPRMHSTPRVCTLVLFIVACRDYTSLGLKEMLLWLFSEKECIVNESQYTPTAQHISTL